MHVHCRESIVIFIVSFLQFHFLSLDKSNPIKRPRAWCCKGDKHYQGDWEHHKLNIKMRADEKNSNTELFIIGCRWFFNHLNPQSLQSLMPPATPSLTSKISAIALSFTPRTSAHSNHLFQIPWLKASTTPPWPLTWTAAAASCLDSQQSPRYVQYVQVSAVRVLL